MSPTQKLSNNVFSKCVSKSHFLTVSYLCSNITSLDKDYTTVIAS